MDLFDYMRENQKDDDSPLAKRMRPENLDEVIGQEHIIGRINCYIVRSRRISWAH